ncbi:MAG TPA: hypothetical protein ENI62_10835 [Gammaproteobacteria bacterium]|nr:hypothetical protein [Gammaproteobacteria bacterium]
MNKGIPTKKRVNTGLLLGIALTFALLIGLLSRYVSQHQPNAKVTKQKIVPGQINAFREQVNKMVSRYTVRRERGIPIVHPPAGSDIYLLARNYNWGHYILELERGKPYRLHLASLDMRHAIVVHELRLMYRIKPDEFKVVKFTPDKAGRFQLLCGEWCGIGHASMTSQLLVTDAPPQG